MTGARALPKNYNEIYTQACTAFTHKLQCQIFVLLSPRPSPDSKHLGERLEELAEKIQQIGYLAEVGEFRVRDHRNVMKRWGVRSVREICGFIRSDLLFFKGELGKELSLVMADRLVRVLDTLPF